MGVLQHTPHHRPLIFMSTNSEPSVGMPMKVCYPLWKDSEGYGRPLSRTL
jgi:hypothetical protein